MTDSSDVFMNAPTVTCVRCRRPVRADGEPIADYLMGRGLKCPDCNEAIDLWTSFQRTLVVFHAGFTLGHLPLGTQTTMFRIAVPVDTSFELVFSNYHVPEDAVIIHINYTGYGGGEQPGRVLEIHGNEPRRVHPRERVYLYGASYGRRTEPITCGVSVTWVQRSANDAAWTSLSMAFEMFLAERFELAAFHAQAAVELTVKRALACALTGFQFEAGHIKRIFKRVNHAEQMGAVIPDVARFLGVPQLPDPIAKALQRLRDERNTIAHEPGATYDQPKAAEMLCAGVFGFQYALLIEDALVRRFEKEGLQ